MSTSVMRPECRKFAPNIFNKSKCTNCFKQKEEHSPEALESNRATRKVAKCGYLFVAPGWDFSNPLNRTKRWQRRWFVLYDDGELSYSVDEHPDTVPQASIDMNKVLEVTDAEEVTGNAYSLAITAPDHVHFVKGTSREECRWWMEVLSVFPRSKGRHKRNATFPGSQSSSSILPQSPSLRTATPTDGRPRYNSVHSDHSPTHPNVQSWLPAEADVFPTRESSSSLDTQIHAVKEYPVSAPVDTRKTYRDQPATSASPPTRDKIQTEEKARTRRILNREKRGIKSARSYSEDFSGMLPSWKNAQETQEQNEVARRLMFEDDTKRDEKLKDIADSITRPRYRRNDQSRSPYHKNSDNLKPTRDGEYSEEDDKKCCDRSESPRNVDHTDSISNKLVRGDPDGCGLDLSSHRYSPSSELRVDLPAEDLLNIKKGWLMKQSPDKEWNKHWFVLRGSALMYYRDPSAEDKGIMDGVIDLSGVSNVTEVQVARNYGFQTVTWDDRKYILSAVTSGIRGNWMSAIRRAAGLQDPPPDSPLTVGEKIERELDKTQFSSSIQSPCLERECSVSSSGRRGVLFSSDDEYRTASECGRRDSEDWNEPLALLPPSPPLNRTPISRVKEKARSRSNSRSRVYKRSKSSPPSSRHSTLDSVRSEDLVIACCGELPESDAEESAEMESVKSSLYDTVDSQSSELDELKRRLNNALCDVSSAEKEVIKLRQNNKTEIATLEKQIKELSSTLEQTRDQLQKKTKDANEAEMLRKSYEALMKEHEELLTRWRQQIVDGEWRERYHKLEDRFHLTSESWEHKLHEAESAYHDASDRCDLFSRELASSRELIEHLQNEVLTLSKRLAQGIEENESLYRRLRELEGRSGSNSSLSTSRERGRSMDSLSDLTNIDLDLNLSDMDKERIIEEYDDLRGRFEKAIQEIRAMKRELRESHAMYDELELQCISLRQDAKRQEDGDSAQLSLMVSRVEDLTLKLSAAEKQVRNLKQKLSKAESRDKRRSLSLKGRESFQICKELEEKLGELEAKVTALESGKPVPKITSKSKHGRSESQQECRKESGTVEKTKESSRIRRKSLDSATSSEPMKVLIRLNTLESKISKCAEEMGKRDQSLSPPPATSAKSKSQTIHPVQVSVEKVPEPMDTDENQTDVFLRLHTLEGAISSSREKVKECLNLVSSLKKFTPSKSQALLQSDSFIFLENYLAEVRETLQLCNDQCSEFRVSSPTSPSADKDAINSVQKLVRQFEEILQNKLIELCKRRAALRESGQLDEEARMKLLAEKMAYESVLISRIIQAIACGSSNSRDFMKWMMTSELNDCNRLIAGLKSKLDGSTPAICCETSVAYMTRVLSKKLLLQLAVSKYLNQQTGKESSSSPQKSQCSAHNSDLLEVLLKQQQECEAHVNRYKKEKLHIIAKALANETLSISSDESDAQSSEKRASDVLTLEDRRIREAWEMAQEAVNRELVHAEISHVTMRCGQAYEANLSLEQETYFGFAAVHRSLLEQWCDTVETLLRKEMEAGIDELTRKYEECLSNMKKEKPRVIRRHTEDDDAESRRLLFEFADIMAHKALIDARIAVIHQEIHTAGLSDLRLELNSKENNIKSMLEADNARCGFDDHHSHENNFGPELVSEFEYLFQHFFKMCCVACVGSNVNLPNTRTDCEDEVKRVLRKLSSLRDSLITLEDCLLDQKSKSSVFQNACDSKSKTDTCKLSDVYDVCDRLRQQIDSLTSKALQSRSCQRCQQLQETLRRLNADHEEELKMLQHCQEQEMMRLRQELEQQKHCLVSQHEHEQAQLKQKARRLERRLGTLDSEYSQEVENLRSEYQKSLSAELERDLDGEENIRQRYQAEIEHLRALCEKGLLAMENSHRRIIAELEEKHRQELQQMRLEKEQALAEETQATLAALDAMRKAHEIEVQKECAKFKEEYIKKMQSTHDIGALHKAHEEEMEEIKQEILSLSEKYSIKCVECATLDEQLVQLTKQLSQAQQQIQQLDARNKQLRAHLVSEASDIEVGNMAQLLREKSQELENKYEEVEHLQQELASVNKHGAELSALCTQLSSQFACTEHRGDDTSTSLLLRLQQMAAAWPSQNKGHKAATFNRTQSDGFTRNEFGSFKIKQHKEPSTLATAELIRSPQRSCSLTHNFLSVAPLHSPSLCSLSGMVAERKKVFEH